MQGRACSVTPRTLVWDAWSSDWLLPQPAEPFLSRLTGAHERRGVAGAQRESLPSRSFTVYRLQPVPLSTCPIILPWSA